MKDSNFSKAYNLTGNIIDIEVPCGSMGIFLLGYTPCNNGKFNPLYISRCDFDLNSTLKEHIGNFSQFKFCLFESNSDAFFYECKLYHYLTDTIFIINESHPSAPPGLLLKCPVCGK